MANKYYQEGEKRAQRVNDLFAQVAPRYDFINDLQSFGLHRAWKRRLIRLAHVQPGDLALDVCCGTGDIAFRLSRAGATTTGYDFSAAMLAVAQRRREQLRQPHQPTFIQGDAQRLPFNDSRFDVVTVGYGLRNLPSWEQGLAEMHRVAKPGARLLVLDFGKPDNPAWRAMYFTYLRRLVPIFGRLFCGDAATHSYILESLVRYPAQRGVAAKMEQLGCRNIAVVNLMGGAMSINAGEK